MALPPEHFNRLADGVSEKLTETSEAGINPAIVTSSQRRRYIKTVLTARGIPQSVLSFEELGLDSRPAIVGLVPA